MHWVYINTVETLRCNKWRNLPTYMTELIFFFKTNKSFKERILIKTFHQRQTSLKQFFSRPLGRSRHKTDTDLDNTCIIKVMMSTLLYRYWFNLFHDQVYGLIPISVQDRHWSNRLIFRWLHKVFIWLI
jgi:hypothetical protein